MHLRKIDKAIKNLNNSKTAAYLLAYKQDKDSTGCYLKGSIEDALECASGILFGFMNQAHKNHSSDAAFEVLETIVSSAIQKYQDENNVSDETVVDVLNALIGEIYDDNKKEETND